MSKITIPLTAVQSPSGVLFDFYYNLVNFRSDVVKMQDDVNVYLIDGFDLTINQLGQILAQGGEVEEYLMAIQAPIAILDINVSYELPNYQKLNSSAALGPRAYKEWFDSTAEVWKKDDDTEIIFMTNPLGQSSTDYLKASEISILHALPNVNAIQVAQKDIIVENGWTRIQ